MHKININKRYLYPTVLILIPLTNFRKGELYTYYVRIYETRNYLIR